MKKFFPIGLRVGVGQIKTKFHWFLISWIIIIAALDMAASADNLPGRLKAYTIQTGSMKPAVPVGSLVVVQPKGFYEIGEIITFEFPDTKETVTHRIVNLNEQNNNRYYITKGDANLQVDRRLIPPENIFGGVVAVIPLLGYLIDFVETRLGLAFLLVMPATLVIRTELLKIKKEIDKN